MSDLDGADGSFAFNHLYLPHLAQVYHNMKAQKNRADHLIYKKNYQ